MYDLFQEFYNFLKAKVVNCDIVLKIYKFKTFIEVFCLNLVSLDKCPESLKSVFTMDDKCS